MTSRYSHTYLGYTDHVIHTLSTQTTWIAHVWRHVTVIHTVSTHTTWYIPCVHRPRDTYLGYTDHVSRARMTSCYSRTSSRPTRSRTYRSYDSQCFATHKTAAPSDILVCKTSEHKIISTSSRSVLRTGLCTLLINLSCHGRLTDYPSQVQPGGGGEGRGVGGGSQPGPAGGGEVP